MNNDYLSSVKKQMESYKSLGEKTFAQLPDEKLFWQYPVGAKLHFVP